jgi:3-oxoadipate enol-lactonase
MSDAAQRDGKGRAGRINVAGLGRLPAFSHAGVAGDLIFVSGTLGTLEGFALAPGGIGPQTTQTLRNIERILAEAGASFDDVVKVNVYVDDMAGFADMNKAYREFFTGEPPARITVGGAKLALDAAVEIDCIAQRPPATRPDLSHVRRTTGFVASGPEQIYYESFGSGTPLVLCHGYGGSHAIWFQQVPAFAAGRQVVTWDHRGFGRSTNSARESGPEVAVDDLLALLDHLGLERVDLVGQSMGGWTVLGFALAHPSRVRTLTLADTIGGLYTDEIQRRFADYVGRAASAPPPESLPIGQHPALGSRIRALDPARALLYGQIGSMTEPPPVEIPALLRSTRRDPAGLAASGIPLLFIVGDEDPIFPPDVIRMAAGLVPGARVVEIPGSGHSPYFEDPEAWNRVLAGFIGS